MSGFIFYQKKTLEETRQLTNKAVLEVIEWFKKNPKRRICRIELWYGTQIKVRKNHVKEDIEEAEKKLIDSGRVIL